MRAYKNLLAIAFILLFSFTLAAWMTKRGNVAYLISITLMSIFLFNIIVRNRIWFKPYFVSSWNIFSSKFRRDFEFDIPRELVLEKIIEVMQDSPFEIKYVDRETYEILAVSKLSWLSWGENIYLALVEADGKTRIRFDSVALFQLYTWGKNEKNFDIFLEKLEDSLTI